MLHDCEMSRDIKVLPSMCDGESRLSIPAAFDLFQDTATLHADRFDIGPAGMHRRNYFWIISKTAMRIHRLPAMMENIQARTWIQAADRARCERDFALYSGEEKLLELRSIWAVMSHDTGRIVPMTGLYPELEFDIPSPEDIEFSRIGRDFDDAVSIGEYKIRSVDIDLGGHMNNVNYIRAALGCFTSDEISGSQIRDIEVQYLSQSYEGERLRFMKREMESGTDIGAVKEDGKSAFLARIGFAG